MPINRMEAECAVDTIPITDGRYKLKFTSDVYSDPSAVILSSHLMCPQAGLFKLVTVFCNNADLIRDNAQKELVADTLKSYDDKVVKDGNLDEYYKNNKTNLSFYYFMAIERIKMAINKKVPIYAPFTNEQLREVIDNGYKTEEEVMKVRGLGNQFRKFYLQDFLAKINEFYNDYYLMAGEDEFLETLQKERAELVKKHKEESILWQNKMPSIELNTNNS